MYLCLAVPRRRAVTYLVVGFFLPQSNPYVHSVPFPIVSTPIVPLPVR